MTPTPCKICGSTYLVARSSTREGVGWVTCDKCGNNSTSVPLARGGDAIIKRWNLENAKDATMKTELFGTVEPLQVVIPRPTFYACIALFDGKWASPASIRMSSNRDEVEEKIKRLPSVWSRSMLVEIAGDAR